MPEHNPSPTPERALFGFALYISSFITFVCFIIWAYVPEEYLHQIGLRYLPDRSWAVVIPAFACTSFVLFTSSYFMWNLFKAYKLAGEIEEYSYLEECKINHESIGDIVPSLYELDVPKRSHFSSKTVCTVPLPHFS